MGTALFDILDVLFDLSFFNMALSRREHVYRQNYAVCVSFVHDCKRSTVLEIGNYL